MRVDKRFIEESDKNCDIVVYQLIEEKALLSVLGSDGEVKPSLHLKLPKASESAKEPGLRMPGNRSY